MKMRVRHQGRKIELELRQPASAGGNIGGFLIRGIGIIWRHWRESVAQGRRPGRLSLVERISLGPKHALALVNADGVSLLVAMNAEGAPAFYVLNGKTRPAPESVDEIGARRFSQFALRRRGATRAIGRVSW